MPAVDHRQATRTPFEQAIQVVDIESGIEFAARTIDGSKAGLSFCTAMEPAMGAEMEVSFGDDKGTSAFKVVRIARGQQGFTVAGQLRPRWQTGH